MATDDAYLAFDDVLQFVTTRPTGLHRPAAESVAKSDRSIAPRVARVAARRPRQNVRERSAVALGGLAGNNAHGAGFLEALRLSGKAPQIITCTSGQILWTATYLRGESLKDTFAKQLEGYRPFGELLDLNVLRNVANNDVQRIRLALAEFPEDFAALYAESWKRFWANPFAFSFLRETLGLWPARSLVNQDGATFYEEMADQFNSENEIGIAFNAYDFKKGIEVVYLNEVAARLMGKDWDTVNARRTWVVYKPITAEGIENALRLYEYGSRPTIPCWMAPIFATSY